MTSDEKLEKIARRYGEKSAAKKMAEFRAILDIEYRETVAPAQEAFDLVMSQALHDRVISEREAKEVYNHALSAARDAFVAATGPDRAILTDMRKAAQSRRDRQLKALEHKEKILADILTKKYEDGYKAGYADAVSPPILSDVEDLTAWFNERHQW